MPKKPERIDAATFAESLKLLGWNRADAARELGVASQQRIGDWLRGKRPVPIYVAKAIAFRIDTELRKRGL